MRWLEYCKAPKSNLAQKRSKSKLSPEISCLHTDLSKCISDHEYIQGNAAFSSGFATLVSAAIVVQGHDSLSTGVRVGISIGITFLWAAQNALRIDQQGWINNFAAFLQLGSTIVIVLVLFVMTPERATTHDVFTSTYNSTGFPFPYVCFIGILSTLFSFSGYEGNRSDFQHVLILLPSHSSGCSYGGRDERCWSRR